MCDGVEWGTVGVLVTCPLPSSCDEWVGGGGLQSDALCPQHLFWKSKGQKTLS